jgi:hypothetical protein
VFVSAAAVVERGVPVSEGLAMLAFRLSAVVTKAVVASRVVLLPAVCVTPLVLPLSVVVEVPVVEPMAMLVVEPATPFVPMLTVLVEALIVAPVPTLIVPVAVELPRVWLGLAKTDASL